MGLQYTQGLNSRDAQSDSGYDSRAARWDRMGSMGQMNLLATQRGGRNMASRAYDDNAGAYGGQGTGGDDSDSSGDEDGGNDFNSRGRGGATYGRNAARQGTMTYTGDDMTGTNSLSLGAASRRNVGRDRDAYDRNNDVGRYDAAGNFVSGNVYALGAGSNRMRSAQSGGAQGQSRNAYDDAESDSDSNSEDENGEGRYNSLGNEAYGRQRSSAARAYSSYNNGANSGAQFSMANARRERTAGGAGYSSSRYDDSGAGFASSRNARNARDADYGASSYNSLAAQRAGSSRRQNSRYAQSSYQ